MASNLTPITKKALIPQENTSSDLIPLPNECKTYINQIEEVGAINMNLNLNYTQDNSTQNLLPLHFLFQNHNYYNLIVSDSIALNIGESFFSLPTKFAFYKYTEADLTSKFATLTENIKKELLSFPSVFMHENTSYGSPSPSQNFALGRIININASRESITFTTQILSFLPQKILNDNRQLFGICGHENTTELDYCHWSIKKINLLSALRELGISI